jgi:hypothetical protein
MHTAYYLVFNRDSVNIDDFDVLSCKTFQFLCSKNGCPNLTPPIRINGRCQPNHMGSCIKCKKKPTCVEKPNQQLPVGMHIIMRRNRAAGVDLEKNIKYTESIIPDGLVDNKKSKMKEAIQFWARLYHAAPPDVEESTDAMLDLIANNTEDADVNHDASIGETFDGSDVDMSNLVSSDSNSNSVTHRTTSPIPTCVTAFIVNTNDSHQATYQSPFGESSPVIGTDPQTPSSLNVDPLPEPDAEPMLPQEMVVDVYTNNYHSTALRLAQSLADGSSLGVDATHRLEALRICADLIRLKKEETSDRIKEAEIKLKTVVS